MPNPILDAARQRLLAITAERAALDREEHELRAMVAAAEGAQPSPMPSVTPSPVLVPGAWPPFTPWIVKEDHGGACACPHCLSRVTCGEGTVVRIEMPGAIYVGDMNPSAGSVMAVGAQTISLVGSDASADRVTVSGSCGAVSTFTASLLTSAN